MNTFLVTLLSLEVGALALALYLYRNARRGEKKRRVEAPNSTYKSRYVEDLESFERWERMDLSRLHELNRGEVEKLLAKVRGSSVRALTSQERAFLERMADAYDRVVRNGVRRGPSGARPSPASSTP